ncbi:hypothetical protein [Pleomorphomonas sp. PLEO]|uniref:hypothetical protein n=1 Tax=Pleomorphomonas sp. PLEO TaxID=3239306 RepID=UPI00351F2083
MPPETGAKLLTQGCDARERSLARDHEMRGAPGSIFPKFLDQRWKKRVSRL